MCAWCQHGKWRARIICVPLTDSGTLGRIADFLSVTPDLKMIDIRSGFDSVSLDWEKYSLVGATRRRRDKHSVAAGDGVVDDFFVQNRIARAGPDILNCHLMRAIAADVIDLVDGVGKYVAKFRAIVPDLHTNDGGTQFTSSCVHQ